MRLRLMAGENMKYAVRGCWYVQNVLEYEDIGSVCEYIRMHMTPVIQVESNTV